MFIPVSCAGCGATVSGPCPSCWATLTRHPIRRPTAELDSVTACCAYEGAAAALVGAFKFRGHHRLARPLGQALAGLVELPVDAITWIPATAAHRRRRGYDQARLLAGAVAAELDVSSRRLLRRSGRRGQLGSTRSERLAGPTLRACGDVPRRVLVVDDVVTTGSSLAAAALVLRQAGAVEIHGVAVAATRP